jgi:hypothetical protein
MLPGRYLFVFVVMIWGTNSVPAHAEMIQVTIDKLVFSPEELKAKVGDTIAWINKDIVAHTATARGDWDVMIPANKSASLVLTKAGIVEYLPLPSKHEGTDHHRAGVKCLAKLAVPGWPPAIDRPSTNRTKPRTARRKLAKPKNWRPPANTASLRPAHARQAAPRENRRDSRYPLTGIGSDERSQL